MGGPLGGKASLHSPSVSASELAIYTKGIHFPASKQDILDVARRNSAPQNVMQFFDALPEGDYASPAQIEAEFSKLKQGMGTASTAR